MKSISISVMFFLFLASVLPAREDALEKRLRIVNREIKRLNLPWKTKLSYEKHALGLIKSDKTIILPMTKQPKALSLPVAIDWRNYNGQNYITPIKNQGGCGSCWAFAAVGTIEAMWKIEQQRPDLNPDLSEQDLVSCSTAGSCGGGDDGRAAEWIRTYGIMPEYCFAYVASDVLCSYCQEGDFIETTLQGWDYVTTKNEDIDGIKNALQNGPVSTSMEIYDDFYNFYDSGVYVKTPGSELVGFHAVVIVGYDDLLDCWIVKNSWGANWGENGYFRIKRGQLGSGEPDGYDSLLGSYSWSANGVTITKVGEGF